MRQGGWNRRFRCGKPMPPVTSPSGPPLGGPFAHLPKPQHLVRASLTAYGQPPYKAPPDVCSCGTAGQGLLHIDPPSGGGKGGGSRDTADPPGGQQQPGCPSGLLCPLLCPGGLPEDSFGHSAHPGVGHQNVLTNAEAGPHARHGSGGGVGIPPPS